MRVPALLVVAAAALCVSGCHDQKADLMFPRAPARCAGPRQGHDGGLGEWRSGRDSVLAAPSESTTLLWVTFDRARSVAEASSLARGHRMHGVALVWRERQGTTVKAVDTGGPPFDSRQLGAKATALLAQSPLGRDNPALQPVDERVVAGEPPIGGLLLDEAPSRIADFVTDHRCAVYSIAAGAGVLPSTLSPEIEPDHLYPPSD